MLIMLGSVSQPITGPSRTIGLWLGTISYPIYAVHDPVHDWTSILLGRHPVLGAWYSTLVILTLVVIAAPLEQVYHRRVGTWLSRLAGTRLSDF